MSNLNSKVFKKGTSNPLSRALGSKLKLLKSSLIVCVCVIKMENPTMIQMETFASEIEDKILDFHVPR